jgi:hypothetical protein
VTGPPRQLIVWRARSVSNLGSSVGTALVGSVLVAAKLPAGKPFALALATLLVIALIGLAAAFLIPRQPAAPATHDAGSRPAPGRA